MVTQIRNTAPHAKSDKRTLWTLLIVLAFIVLAYAAYKGFERNQAMVGSDAVTTGAATTGTTAAPATTTP